VFSALDYAMSQVHWQMSARKGDTAFIAFLDHLAQTLPGSANEPDVLVPHNVGYHQSHALREVW